MCLSNIAGFYLSHGKFIEAEPLLKRALKIRETVLDQNDPDLGASLEAYSFVLRKMQRSSEAEIFYARAKAIYEQNKGQKQLPKGVKMTPPNY
jgi:tetratricopeptide (TPR) repeat protein